MVKVRGGYLPKISGAPADTLEEVACPEVLSLALLQKDTIYKPSVESGDTVKLGQALASADAEGGTLSLASPAAGTVTVEESDGKPVRISIKCTGGKESCLKAVDTNAKPEAICGALAAGGVLQNVWSSSTDGTPSLKDSPKAIIITLSLTEPFRASSDVVWNKWKDRSIKGMEFLGRILADGGKLEIACGDAKSAAFEGIKAAGGPEKRFHDVPYIYPVENPIVISKALRKEGLIAKDAVVWVMDLQAVAAAGACLAEGVPLSQRIIASGGPANKEPKHYLAAVGTPVSNIVSPKDNLLVLRGGLFKGMPADETACIGPADDALFSMPAEGKRELFSFISPGFNRRSIYPVYAAALTGAPDSHLAGTIRGEHRPCVACSSCEKVCPVDIMPQAIHRLLYSEEYDDAEALGLNRCVDCGACTYVCPSKIDLNTEFVEARRLIKAEEDAVAALSALNDKKDG